MAMRHNLLALVACLAFVIGCSDDQDNGGNAVQDVTPTPGPGTPGDTKPDDPKPPEIEPEDPKPEKPEPVVQDPIQFAIQFNSQRLLPIRFILKLKQSLEIPVDRTTIASAVAFDEATIKAIEELQTKWFGSSRQGIIDAETLIKIEDELFHEDGMNALIGPYTQPDDILISGLKEDSDEVAESVYQRCQEIIEQYGGYFDTTSGRRNMLALRGAMLDGDKLRRTQTAKLYIDHVHDSSPESNSTVHFASGMELHPASGLIPFDDIMLTIWKEEVNGEKHYHVQALPLNLDPGMQGGNTDGYPFDGTAHLRDGQYIGIIDRHSTSMFNHAHAVLQACHDNPDVYDLLSPKARDSSYNYNYIPFDELEEWLNKEKLPRIQYTGINNIYNKHTYNGIEFAASGTSEVIRDFHLNGKSSDGVIKDDEWNTARKVLANLFPNDSLLQIVYPESDLNDALDEWFKTYFVAYTEQECRNLFEYPASDIYADGNAGLRSGLFKNVFVRYRDTIKDIAINIHTSPDNETSSQGCLNIPISNYPSYLSVLAAEASQQEYLYTVVDASKVMKQ